MSKFTRATVLTLVLAGFAAVAMPSSLAQKKDDVKKTDAKKATGTVQVYEAKDGWRFKVTTMIDGEEKTVAMGTKGYEKKEDAVKMIEQLKEILATTKITDGKSTK